MTKKRIRKSEFRHSRVDWGNRYRAENSYLCKVSRIMMSNESYTVRGLVDITKIPRTRLYGVLKILVDCGILEKIEPEIINFPPWYEQAGVYAQKTWRDQNNIVLYKKELITKWRRVNTKTKELRTENS